MMRLFVLGGLRVEHDAHAVELPAARKARLLLAVLAIERRPLGRSELAGRLWPDVLPDSARASLRNALAQLRAALGPVADEVIVADTAGALALGPDVWSDVAEVDRLLAAGRPEEAVAAIGGELLPGFDDDWVYEQRDDLRRRLVGSLEAAAADAEAGGELATAIRLSQHGADLEPLAERLHRDLIRRLAAGGDRGAALAAYERLRGRLADALHAAPSAPTRALVDQIRGGRGEPPPDQRSRIRYTRRDGHALAYQRFGSGPADLLVVPGWVSNLDEVWDFPPLGPLFARLGEIARCVVFDKRGTGLSERDLGFGSLEERAEDIRAVMDAAGLARASLFAFSESAALAVVFAAAHPDRVDRLILYSSYARLVAAPGYEGGFPPELVDAFVDRIRSDWGSGNPSRISFQGIPADDDAARRLGRWERSVCTPTMAAHIIRSNADIDVRSLLPGVMAPTLVLHSTGDPVTPAALGRYVADHVPRASYVEQDAGYHLPWDGGTAWFVDAIAAFLAAAVPDAEPSHTFLSTVLYARGGAPGESGRGGEVVHSAEGEFAAIFDSPSRAIARALELSRGGASVAVHTGELERTGHTVSGTAIELAAAVAQVAESGEVLVTSSVRDLTAGSGLSFTERTAADGSALFVVSD